MAKLSSDGIASGERGGLLLPLYFKRSNHWCKNADLTVDDVGEHDVLGSCNG